MSQGKIVQIIGAVVDVEFPRNEVPKVYDALKVDGTEITLEGTGLFARMLQHETGHLDGFTYLDRLIGRHARAAKRMVKSNKWGVPGLSWLPGEDPDPFGH